MLSFSMFLISCQALVTTAVGTLIFKKNPARFEKTMSEKTQPDKVLRVFCIKYSLKLQYKLRRECQRYRAV